jgi:DNA invertase Pin-like site-specific DNA recombinase
MTVYGYARVSTRTQDVAGQVAQLRAAGVNEIHTETSSGAGRRPVLDELLEYLRAGDLLVVTALDRLGRVGRSLLELVDDLAGRGVGLRTLHGGIDTTDPIAGRIVLYVIAALAEAERALIVERSWSTRRAAVRHDARSARRRPPAHGPRRDGDDRPRRPRDRRLAFDLEPSPCLTGGPTVRFENPSRQ